MHNVYRVQEEIGGLVPAAVRVCRATFALQKLVVEGDGDHVTAHVPCWKVFALPERDFEVVM
jgi:hypothetical protein